MATQLLAVRIVPLVRSKCGLDLGYYSSVVKLNDLTTDLFMVYEYLKVEEIRPVVANVLNLWQRHYDTLKPLLDCGVENVRKLVTDPEFRKKILARILLNVRLIAVGLQMALAVVFVYQCTQLWSIRGAIKQAINYVNDEDVKLEFAQVEKNVEELKEISNEVNQLVEQYEKSRNQKEMERLLEQINQKLVAVDNFKDTSDMIENLQTKLSTQQTMLLQCDDRFLQTGLTSLSASGIGLLTILIRDKLAEIERSLGHLSDDCEIEFKCTMEHICAAEERKEQVCEARKVVIQEASAQKSGMIGNLVKVADGWRIMASSYMKIL